MSELAKNKISYRARISRVRTVKTGSRLNNPLFYLRLIGHIATSLSIRAQISIAYRAFYRAESSVGP